MHPSPDKPHCNRMPVNQSLSIYHCKLCAGEEMFTCPLSQSTPSCRAWSAGHYGKCKQYRITNTLKCIHKYVPACTHTHWQTHVPMCTHAQTHIHAHTCTSTHSHTHTHMCTHTHVYMCTHTPLQKFQYNTLRCHIHHQLIDTQYQMLWAMTTSNDNLSLWKTGYQNTNLTTSVMHIDSYTYV